MKKKSNEKRKRQVSEALKSAADERAKALRQLAVAKIEAQSSEASAQQAMLEASRLRGEVRSLQQRLLEKISHPNAVRDEHAYVANSTAISVLVRGGFTDVQSLAIAQAIAVSIGMSR